MRNTIILLISILLFACKKPQARKPVTVKTGSFIKNSIERNKKLNDNEVEVIQLIMKNSPEKNFVNSKHGFWYYYNTKIDVDSVKTAEFGDIVHFDYDIKDLEGNIIYTKKELKTQVYTVDKQEVFQGLREAIKLLKQGETATFYFPSQMAYGYYGDENKIGTNIPLICEISINSITDK